MHARTSAAKAACLSCSVPRGRADDRGHSLAVQVFVGNLPPEAEARDLRDFFRDFGQINDAWVARKPPGFGFVWFDDERDAVLPGIGLPNVSYSAPVVPPRLAPQSCRSTTRRAMLHGMRRPACATPRRILSASPAVLKSNRSSSSRNDSNNKRHCFSTVPRLTPSPRMSCAPLRLQLVSS